MTNGILLYCFDTPFVKYSAITDRCISLIHHYLGLPVTVVTDQDTKDKIKSDCNFQIMEKIEKNNTKLSRPWYNLERHMAYEHSPYDQTIVLDVDYFCFSDKLRQLLDTKYDFLVHKKAHDVFLGEIMNFDSESMIDLVWATVLIFKKTPRAKAIFDTVKLVKQNYLHFRNLYRITCANYRNDYAFAIALTQIYGHKDYDTINDSMATVPANSKIMELGISGAVIECGDKTLSLYDQDLHFLNKDVADV